MRTETVAGLLVVLAVLVTLASVAWATVQAGAEMGGARQQILDEIQRAAEPR